MPNLMPQERLVKAHGPAIFDEEHAPGGDLAAFLVFVADDCELRCVRALRVCVADFLCLHVRAEIFQAVFEAHDDFCGAARGPRGGEVIAAPLEEIEAGDGAVVHALATYASDIASARY